MSFMSPKTATPKKPESKPLDAVSDRGRTGRSILAGSTDTEDTYKKKTILGG